MLLPVVAFVCEIRSDRFVAVFYIIPYLQAVLVIMNGELAVLASRKLSHSAYILPVLSAAVPQVQNVDVFRSSNAEPSLCCFVFIVGVRAATYRAVLNFREIILVEFMPVVVS